jgi:glycosyltransferase involved in cell wall biosynthesis
MLSIIIPTHNKASRLRLCLRALAEALRQSIVPCEIVVVDDGSRDDTAAVLTAARDAMYVSFCVIPRESPGGRSVARNVGAAAATGRRLLFLDDDMLIDFRVLERHVSAQYDTPQPVIARATILNLPWLRAVRDPTKRSDNLPEGLASRLISTDAGTSFMESVGSYARRTRFEADLHRLFAAREGMTEGRWLAATGGNLSVSREFFEQLGGFDERMGLHWGAEDLEFGFRAERAGAVVVHLADVVAYHMDHEVVGREADHQIALRYFSEKHGVNVGERLVAYFAGALDILAVVQP